MQPFTLRWLIPFTLVVLLLAACGDTADDSADSTLAPTTTTTTTTTEPTATTTTTTQAETTTTPADEPPILGDASLIYVPMGNSLTFTPYDGTSFIGRYTTMLREDFGIGVETRDHTVGGQRTDDFLAQLRTNDQLREDLGDADVVTLLIPNDEWGEPFETAVGGGGRDPSDCGGDDNQQCLRDVIDSYKRDVDQIFEELTAIVDPAETPIRVQDFYLFMTNVATQETFDIMYPYWREGQEYVEQVAGQYGIPVAQVFDDFMGTDGLFVDLVANGLVDPDGIHPTAEGAERIADLMHALGYDPIIP